MRRRDGQDSMELLLDTICNVFGGILFLALLVCLLTQQASRQVTLELPPDELLALRMEHRKADLKLQQAQQQLDSARAQLQHRADLLKTLVQTADPRLGHQYQQLLEEMSRLSREREQLVAASSQAGEELRRSEAAVEKAEEAYKAAEEARNTAAAQAEQQLAEAHAAAEAAKEKQVIRLRLPRARVTSKREAVVFVSHGRMYMPIRYDASGWPEGLDPRVTTQLSEDDGIGPQHLRRTSGIPVEATDRVLAGVDRKLSMFDPTVHYITLAVWPDSYSQFRILRDHVVRKGFEYRLLLLGPGEPVGFGSVVPHVQ